MNRAAKIPMTQMQFKVWVSDMDGWAVFAEVSGECFDLNELLPFAAYMGTAKHGCVILRQGYVTGEGMKRWIDVSVSGGNLEAGYRDVTIELTETADTVREAPGCGSDCVWKLKKASVVKYTGNSLKDGSSKCAVGEMELAYEEMTVLRV